MDITSTRDAALAGGLKILVHGPPGAGKTRLCATTDDPSRTLILSAEAGLLSLRDYDLPVVTIRSIADLRSAYLELRRDLAPWDWICLDSISEIAEVCLGEERKTARDGRAAYGQLAEIVYGLLRAFRDLPTCIYMSAKQGREDLGSGDGGGVLLAPSLPGRQLTQGIGYLFDEVAALRVDRTPEGEVTRHLLCQPDGRYEAKDRSGALSPREPASLSHLRARILGALTAGV